MRAELHRPAGLAVAAEAFLRVAEYGRSEHMAEHALADAVAAVKSRACGRRPSLRSTIAQRCLLPRMTRNRIPSQSHLDCLLHGLLAPSGQGESFFYACTSPRFFAMAEFKSTWLYAASMTGGSLTAVQLLVHPADVAAWQDVHVDEDLLYAQGRIEIEAHIGVTEVEHE